jgi:hypothetical protein
MAGTCLMACSNANAKHSAWWILQHLDSLKMRRLNKKVTSPPPLQDICSYADFFIFVLVALTTQLEVAEKALSEESCSAGC